MLIGFIKHNRTLSVIILPIALIVIWLYGFLYPATPEIGHISPVYELLISGIQNYPFLNVLIAFLLILCEALLINFIVAKHEIVETTTYLPALTYIILMSLQTKMLSLHPEIISNLFLLIAIYKFMQSYRKETALSEVFDIGLFIALASLFYIPAVIFLLLLWTGLIIIRPFIWREWVLSFIGFLLPWLYSLLIYFWIGKSDLFEHDFFYQTLISVNKSYKQINFSFSEILQISLLILISFFAAIKLLHDFNTGTVRLKSNLSLLLYFAVFSCISVFMAPQYSMRYFSFFSIPFSIFFSNYFLFAKKTWVAEVLFMLLIISIFINQFIA